MADPRTIQLLKSADGGDPAALDLLYGRERNRLRRLIALRAPSGLLARVDLDDVVQEAYLEAHRRIADYSYQGADSFFRWLASIALNRMKNLGRVESAEKRAKNREVRISAVETVVLRGGIADIEAPQPGPKTLAVGGDELHRLEAALSRLSEIHREVVLLARVEGLSMQEVADRMGRTRNATALLLSRALRKLKNELKLPNHE